MDLELHQLDRRYQGLRIVTASKRRRLMAELCEAGQQDPVVVVPAGADRYVLIDGYQRVSSLEQLGQDTVRAVCLKLSEAEALLWHHHKQRQQSTALEDGWLLKELRDTHGFLAAELSLRLSRSPSWISRRLALIEALPPSVQQEVRRGALCPHAAAKYLVPLARANAGHAATLTKNIAGKKLSVRQVHALYVGWRRSDTESKARLVEQPLLYLKASAEAETKDAAPDPDSVLLGDLHAAEAILRRLGRRLRERGADVPLNATVGDAWSATQQAFDALFAYLKV